MTQIVRSVLVGLLCGLATTADATPTTKPTSNSTLTTRETSSQGQVRLRLKHLQRLLQPSPKPKAPALLPLQADYKGTLVRDVFLLHAKLRIRVHQKETLFRLGGRRGLISELRVNRLPRAPHRSLSGLYSLPLSPGDYVITYTYRLKTPKARGEHKLRLDLPRIARSQLRLQFPGDGWAVRTQPASHLISQTQQNARSQFHMQLPGTGRVSLIWKGKRIERKQQTRFRARVETFVTLQEGLMLGKSRLHIQLLTGSIRTLKFRVDTSVEVLHIGGQSVVEWLEVKSTPKWRMFSVQFSRTIRDKLTLFVRFERTKLPPKTPVALPNLDVPGSEQFSGFLGVLAQADTEVTHHKATAATTVDVRSLPAAIRKQSDRPILLAYRINESPCQVQVKLTKHPWLKVLSTVINRARFETVRTPSGRELTKATYTVTNNRKQFMPLQLPLGATIVSAFVAGNPVQLARSKMKVQGSFPSPKRLRHNQKGKENPNSYLIPLVRSSSRNVGRQFAVEIVYSLQRNKLTALSFALSRLPMTSLEILSYEWDYYFPKSHHPLWFFGNVNIPNQKRILRRLFRRMEADLKAGTPKAWAGGTWKRKRKRINVYNFSGLKERFAPALSSTLSSTDTRTSKQRYRSRFARTQWQLRARLPLVGKRFRFTGQLLRGRAPSIRFLYIQHTWSVLWFWLVFSVILLMTLLFVSGIFKHKGLGWIRILFAIVVSGALFAAGYFLPLTYLAGLQGLIYGFWTVMLIGLIRISETRTYIPLIRISIGYIRIARWWAVAVTFLLLFTNQVGLQIASLFLAIPVYPALLSQPFVPEPTHSPPPNSPPPESSAPTKTTEETEKSQEVQETTSSKEGGDA